VPEVKRDPLPPFNPQFTFLADFQDNLAWAVFGELSYDITDRLEGSVALRLRPRRAREHDRDAAELSSRPDHACSPPNTRTGLARSRGRCATNLGRLAAQGDAALQANDDLMTYLSYSRASAAVGSTRPASARVGIAGIDDLFDEETADTFEAGRQGAVRGQPCQHERQRLLHRGQGHVFLRLRSQTRARRTWETSIRSSSWAWRPSCRLRSPTGSRYTCAAATPTARSRRSTARMARGCLRTWATRLRSSPSTRSTWARSGGFRSAVPTGTSSSGRITRSSARPWFYPDNFTERDTVNLLNLRAGIETDAWSLVAWSRNLTDEDYNAEWSPGPQFFPSPGYANNFVFKAQPQVWGVDLTYRF
jgi:iron complex outermembrane receptor protein